MFIPWYLHSSTWPASWLVGTRNSCLESRLHVLYIQNISFYSLANYHIRQLCCLYVAQLCYLSQLPAIVDESMSQLSCGKTVCQTNLHLPVTFCCLPVSQSYAACNMALLHVTWHCCRLPDFASSAAAPNVDYGAINHTINVTLTDSAAGETCFTLSVLDDTVLEEPLECLVLRIQLPEGSPDMLHIDPGNDSTLRCIMDDDSELVVMVHRLQTLPQLDISNIT